ncbi:endonuclease domain-containing protein [Microbacterium sp. B2969]|uniref:Endonuclease domain-containing protein n=1 Tax=Microbacterium alkaliflavum TaxID=3248839 RepID=A0ABW7QAL9_9MICO
MDISEWLGTRDGIAHRETATSAGFGASAQRQAIAAGAVSVVRRQWLATDSADSLLVKAASTGARVSCISLARRNGWWIPEEVDEKPHLWVNPHARAPQLAEDDDTVVHWRRSIAPAPARQLVDSPENALAHISGCVTRESALVIWESAVRRERLSVDALRRVRWTSVAARECAQSINGLSDSGLETLVLVRLTPWGIPIRQQIVLAGHRVDLLIGERLVVQIDGFANHSTSAQRTQDVANDAELILRGYTVLRFTYAQVIHDWPSVERTIARAIAAGAHRAA